jgi:hypothetical protein
MQKKIDDYLQQTSTLELLDDLPEVMPKTKLVLGFLGFSASSKWTRDSIAEIVMNPVLSALGRMPETLLLPTEGTTSIFLETWAERMKIDCKPIETSWTRMGRRARAIRDGKILKDSTHLVFFLGTRSDYYEKVAIRELKKGRRVFAVDPKTNVLEEWITS